MHRPGIFLFPASCAQSIIAFPFSTDQISILEKPRDTVRPLCAARLLVMGINSNGRPGEMRGDRRGQARRGGGTWRGRDPDDQYIKSSG